MSSKWNRVYGTLFCPVCGQKMQIPRRSKRKSGHIKTMYCGICGQVRDFIEEERTYEAKAQGFDERKESYNA